ncbi:cytochrome-c peroxidase [Mucilaginibacter rubeus]|uniref:Cytochrome-c peroxidase n=1 Tax=Mucilaginibacter rubeus TaxID=2027860 RepID=A0AAE6JBH8_9SPHI|nr:MULTISPECIES: cytochrome c peroxidase [Mucilaginibacter]QEM02592.1 cytochrome-c peroxidase [Mucilaginibacter rubeus]QEM15212.1 cytochrome-c peroxidase [Mucilaginibacter gossypii]QTE42064.1 cytochrome-c peroxidase [Mucilaginibacter rubeus]QTE48665.1 cytochrome-c peroxidase [Mucilaginibacter rubeus]QTE60051.1 cytochrome-c peroxidase [Mucilaginibacter rubeus]
MKKLGITLFMLGSILAFSQSAFRNTEMLTAATLGRKLFFDPILSRTRKISCASCHKEEFAFSDTSAVSLGVHNRKGQRNTPSAMNMSLQVAFFWDGRATTLEQQALIPLQNPIEMDMPITTAIGRLQNNTSYSAAFQTVFHEAPNAANLAKALAAFERTLETRESPFDDWRLNDNEAAVSESAKRGFAIFNSKGRCIQCHFGPDFNDVEFRSIGLYDGKMLRDSGRAGVTKKENDLGRFKIGALRNIAITSPYMHNGMFRTLRQVIDYYNDPDKIVSHPINRDTLLNTPMSLTEQEKTDLESFLVSLTDKRFAGRLKKLRHFTN